MIKRKKFAIALSVIFVLLMLSIGPLISADSAAPKLTRLSADEVIVLLESGKGSATVLFSRPTNITPPSSIEATDALSSSASKPIPGNEISCRLEPRIVKEGASAEVLQAIISVETKVAVEPNTEYKGKAIIFWPDGSSENFEFKIINRATLSMSLTPERLNAFRGLSQPKDIKFRVKNTGKVTISNIKVSSSGLVDSTSQHRANISQEFPNIEIDPDQEKEITVNIPEINLAGLYEGNLDVIANDKVRQAIPLTIKQRGPTNIFGIHWMVWPFLIFLLVLLFTYGLSVYLDSWFGLGGLVRVQAELSLRDARTDFDKLLDYIEKLKTAYPGIRIGKAEIRLAHDLSSIDQLIEKIKKVPIDKLPSEVERFAAIADKNNAFRVAVETAIKIFGGNVEKLKEVVGKLDDVPFTENDLAKYRAELQKVLQDAERERRAAEVAQAGSLEITLPASPSQALESKIYLMAALRQFVIWIVVSAVAYIAFYANDSDFGRSTDYIKVFLWSLGLTQTGAQITAQIKKPSE